MAYKEKYLKYKQKYLNLKKQYGGDIVHITDAHWNGESKGDEYFGNLRGKISTDYSVSRVININGPGEWTVNDDVVKYKDKYGKVYEDTSIIGKWNDTNTEFNGLVENKIKYPLYDIEDPIQNNIFYKLQNYINSHLADTVKLSAFIGKDINWSIYLPDCTEQNNCIMNYLMLRYPDIFKNITNFITYKDLVDFVNNSKEINYSNYEMSKYICCLLIVDNNDEQNIYILKNNSVNLLKQKIIIFYYPVNKGNIYIIDNYNDIVKYKLISNPIEAFIETNKIPQNKSISTAEYSMDTFIDTNKTEENNLKELDIFKGGGWEIIPNDIYFKNRNNDANAELIISNIMDESINGLDESLFFNWFSYYYKNKDSTKKFLIKFFYKKIIYIIYNNNDDITIGIIKKIIKYNFNTKINIYYEIDHIDNLEDKKMVPFLINDVSSIFYEEDNSKKLSVSDMNLIFEDILINYYDRASVIMSFTSLYYPEQFTVKDNTNNITCLIIYLDIYSNNDLSDQEKNEYITSLKDIYNSIIVGELLINKLNTQDNKLYNL